MPTLNLALVVAALLPAQQPATGQAGARRSLLGRVVARDGEPVTGARVTLVGRLVPWLPVLGGLDRIDLESDASGRFRARVLPLRPYSAWATWNDGSGLHATRVAEEILSGKPVRLVEAGHGGMRLRVRVTGLDQWKDRGPFRLRGLPPTANFVHLPVELDENDEAVLPALPGGTVAIDVLCGDGSLLYSASANTSRFMRGFMADWRARKTGKRSAEPRDLEVVAVPPPVAVRVRVVTKDGVAVPNALVRWRSAYLSYASSRYLASPWRNVWTSGGHTDASGRCELKLPLAAPPAEDKGELVFLSVTADGFATGYAGWSSGKPWSNQSFLAAPTEELRVVLDRASPLEGRLTWKGVGLTGVAVVVESYLSILRVGGGGGIGLTCPIEIVRTDEDGRFHVPDRPPRIDEVGLLAVLPADLRRKLVPNGPLPAPTLALRAMQRGRPNKPVHVELSDLTVMRIEVRASDATPVRGAALFAFRVPPGDYQSARLNERSFTDAHGHATMLLPPNATTLTAWAWEHGVSTVDLRAKQDSVSVKLEPFAIFAGRVVSKRKEPLRNVSFSCVGRGTTAAAGLLAESLVTRSLPSGHVDENGRFRAPYVDSPGCYRTIRFNYWHDGVVHTFSYRLEGKPRDDHEVVFELPTKKQP